MTFKKATLFACFLAFPTAVVLADTTARTIAAPACSISFAGRALQIRLTSGKSEAENSDFVDAFLGILQDSQAIIDPDSIAEVAQTGNILSLRGSGRLWPDTAQTLLELNNLIDQSEHAEQICSAIAETLSSRMKENKTRKERAKIIRKPIARIRRTPEVVTALGLSPDGSRLVFVGQSGEFDVFDPTGKYLKKISSRSADITHPPDVQRNTIPPSWNTYEIAMSHDSTKFALLIPNRSEIEIPIFRLESGRIHRRLNAESVPYGAAPNADFGTPFHFSPNDNEIAFISSSSAHNTPVFWNTKNKQLDWSNFRMSDVRREGGFSFDGSLFFNIEIPPQWGTVNRGIIRINNRLTGKQVAVRKPTRKKSVEDLLQEGDQVPSPDNQDSFLGANRIALHPQAPYAVIQESTIQNGAWYRLHILDFSKLVPEYESPSNRKLGEVTTIFEHNYVDDNSINWGVQSEGIKFSPDGKYFATFHHVLPMNDTPLEIYRFGDWKRPVARLDREKGLKLKEFGFTASGNYFYILESSGVLSVYSTENFELVDGVGSLAQNISGFALTPDDEKAYLIVNGKACHWARWGK